MRIIGITGHMGSGKTTVAGLFKQLGAKVIDADKIVNRLLKKRRIKKDIVANFGKGILARGEIDRKKLSEIVFSDTKSLKVLQDIIHPIVIKVIREDIKRLTTRNGVFVIDAPLLIESGLHKEMDKVVVVKTTSKTRLARCARRGFAIGNVKKRLRTQMPLGQKVKYADYIIPNDGTLSETRKKTIDIWKELIYTKCHRRVKKYK